METDCLYKISVVRKQHLAKIKRKKITKPLGLGVLRVFGSLGSLRRSFSFFLGEAL